MKLWNTATENVLDAHYNPSELAERKAQIFEPPVAALNHYVERIRRAHQGDPTVPWFDPAGGGENASVLLLLQDPSEVAVNGSGFITPDNNDPTARNTTIACNAAELPSSMRVHWNIYPWWVKKKGIDGFGPETFAAAMRAALPFADELVNTLLPELAVVVLMGNHAQDGWKKYRKLGGQPRADISTLCCPHPSPLAFPKVDKKTGRLKSELITETLSEARRIATQ